MQLAIQAIGYLVGLPLEVLIIAAMLTGGYKQYPFVFAYVLGDLLTTVVEIRPSLGYGSRTREAVHEFLLIYWVDERIMQTLMFLVVISLIYVAARGQKPRGTVMLVVISGTIVFSGVSFLIHYSSHRYIGQWMTPWTRDLNFGAALLDFGLWGRLISQPNRDYRVLMLSGALGIQFTGQAIGHAIRSVSPSPTIRFLANVLLMLMNLLFIYLWWQALRTRPEARE
jgi:hypothetical protein